MEHDWFETMGEPVSVEFAAWWRQHISEHAETIQDKAEEYGSNSLAAMGRVFMRARGDQAPYDDAEALEIGCALYAYGKMQRVMDALFKGHRPSVDTWHDLEVYSVMAQFIRQKGRWP